MVELESIPVYLHIRRYKEERPVLPAIGLLVTESLLINRTLKSLVEFWEYETNRPVFSVDSPNISESVMNGRVIKTASTYFVLKRMAVLKLKRCK